MFRGQDFAPVLWVAAVIVAALVVIAFWLGAWIF